MIKIGVVAGVLGGLACFIFFYILYLSGVPPLGKYKVDIWIPALTLFIALYFLRRSYGGELHLWQGLGAGFIANTILAIVSGLSLYLFLEYVNPAVIVGYLKESREIMIMSKDQTIQHLGEETYNTMMKGLDTTTAFDIGRDDMFRKIVYGFFMVPIISMIYRKVSH